MVHIFEKFDMKFVVDVNSGAVHVVDDLLYEMISARLADRVAAVDDAEYAEAQVELEELVRQGLLFSDDEYIDKATVIPKGAPVKALCLHVAHDCNLRCEYCFAATGDFGTGRLRMDADTAKQAIDFVIERSGNRRNIEIDFFGGEPLMAMDTVKATVDYARSMEKKCEKNFRFTITTNGMLLSDENIKYINDTMDNVVLSLDGRPEVNDKKRVTPGGGGCYSHIVPKYKKLVSTRKGRDYYVRGTFTKDNLDFANDVLHIAKEGFSNISVEPVVAGTEKTYALKEEDLPAILNEYDRLAAIMAEDRSFSFFHFNIDLAQGPCIIKRIRGCGAGCEYVAITPEGDIYPCHQFVGVPEFRLGNINDGSFDIELSNSFAEMNVFTRSECSDCWARYWCSGGCSASNLQTEGNIKTPNKIACAMEKKRLECAIALTAKRTDM